MRPSLIIAACLSIGGLSLAAAHAGWLENRNLAERYVEEIWNKGNLYVADELLTPQYTRQGPTSETSASGREAFKAYVARERDHWIGMRCMINDLDQGVDSVTFGWTCAAKCKETGRPIRAEGTTILTLAGGMIASEHVSWDVLGVMRQAGLERPIDQRRRNIELSRRLLQEVYAQGNTSAAYDFVAADHILHVPASAAAARGPEGLRDRVEMFRAAFPDLSFTVHDEIADADTVATRWTFAGTHEGEFLGVAATGRRVEASGISIGRYEDGKLAETWGVWDTGEVLEQIKGSVD